MSKTLAEVLAALPPEEAPRNINWNQSDGYPPRLKPSYNVEFLFRLDLEKGIDNKPIGGRETLVVNYTAEIQTPMGSPYLLNPERPPDSGFVSIRFNEVLDYQSPAMLEKGVMSGVQELVRSLGHKIEPWDPAKAVNFLVACDGRRNAFGDVGWTAYFKGSQQQYTTGRLNSKTTKGSGEPRKADLKWPRNADNSLVLEVVDPADTTQRLYGRERILKLHPPKFGTALGAPDGSAGTVIASGIALNVSPTREPVAVAAGFEDDEPPF